VTDITPYCWYLDFPTEELAEAAVRELGPAYRCRICPPRDGEDEEWLVNVAGLRDWDNDQRYDRVEAIAERHGSECTGGDTTINLESWKFVPEPWAADFIEAVETRAGK
jgi:hypothetical protein